jgi:hypothetical protein
MNSKSFTTLVLGGLAALSLGSLAIAGGTTAGSLLLFPYWNNDRPEQTLISVTNTNLDPVNGTIKVQYVYIDDHCLEFNRIRTLTPGDTLSVISYWDNPNHNHHDKGYVYVFAQSPTTGKPVKFDWLVGSAALLKADYTAPLFGYTPFTFKAGDQATALNTDLENGGVGDGQRDLDGHEYEAAPDTLIVPNFISDDNNHWNPRLVMLGLTGLQFTTIVNFLVYNNNEEVFSAQEQIDCWDDDELTNISSVFDNSFLATTNVNAVEVFTGGATSLLPQVGWFSLTGAIANSSAATVVNPSILAMFLQGDDSTGAAGVLPYWQGTRTNGDLLNLSIQPGS